MLFNSYIFLFGFLPIVLIVFAALNRRSRQGALIWLIFASLCFYGFFGLEYLGVIISSIVFNRLAAGLIMRQRRGGASASRRKLAMGAAVAVNLALLGYFKYLNFFIENINALIGTSLPLLDILLPLGISFFTFQQIIFLKDAYDGEITGFKPSHYVFCVAFFPHLVAGPIIKYKHLLAQLTSRSFLRISGPYAAAGVGFFILGLFKKLILADHAAIYADPVFLDAASGVVPAFYQAWTAALAYSFQLYFDFSGYSDMAIGLALLFAIELPVNFNSPYKATGFIDFWRRWHITLSHFLRDCLYIPLGGNRRGRARRYFNLLATMLLGGLWHGAGWTYVLWGGFHGLFLVINHAFRELRGGKPLGSAGRIVSQAATFLAVVLLWTLFRAHDLQAAARMYQGMGGLAGEGSAPGAAALAFLAVLAGIAFLAPNTQWIMSRFKPCVERYVDPSDPRPALPVPRLSMTPVWGALLAIVSVYLVLNLSNNAYFLYFQF